MTSHLGPAASSFLDGALDDATRDEVLTHLAHCAGCRAELAVQRRLRADLRRLPGPDLPGDLTARLLAVGTQSVPVSARPRRRRLRRTARRRAVVGGAAVVLGLGGTLALAGPPPRPPVAPVDPTSAGFVQDHASTSTEVPFDDPDVVSASLGTAP